MTNFCGTALMRRQMMMLIHPGEDEHPLTTVENQNGGVNSQEDLRED